MPTIDQFDNISALDYRYWDKETAQYLSENAFVRYKIRTELALLRSLAKQGVCPSHVPGEVETACMDLTVQEVYEEECRVQHDVRALVNCIQRRVSEVARPFVHLCATSNDIVDTANMARCKDAVEQVLVPALLALESVLVQITLREKDTMQIGRTHGQHAVPITFGFAMAGYVSRLGGCIESIRARAHELTGKFAGAVGAHNAASILLENPEEHERLVLSELGLGISEVATQIVPREAVTRLLSEIVIMLGVLANLSDDMRHLQRSEIAEVGELFEADQVGSSTMPQKRNPINFENVKSIWKIAHGRLVSVLSDQISEHQRDLTGSASSRTHAEIIAYAVSAVKRLERTMARLVVDHESLKRNLAIGGDLVLAEPLYIILASLGHPDAHEKVRVLTLKAQQSLCSLSQIVSQDVEMAEYLERMSESQRSVLSDPRAYTGIAAKRAEDVALRWKTRLAL